MSNLLAGLKKHHINIIDLTIPVWKAEQNKATIGKFTILLRVLSLALVYPYLIIRYLFAAKHDMVLVPYMGQLDMLVLKPIAWLRKKPIVWDVYISLFDTVVFDRQLLSVSHPGAQLLKLLERLDFSFADVAIADTVPHAAYYQTLFSLKTQPTVVPVGANSKEFFPTERKEKIRKTSSVLFYGNLSPMHGVETIVKAAEILSNKSYITFSIVGQGQSSTEIDGLIKEKKLTNVHRLDHIPYQELNNVINSSDVGLGVFAANSKGERVVPNKVYQMLAAGIPVITANSSGIRETIGKNSLLHTIPPNDEVTLAETIISVLKSGTDGLSNSEIRSLAMTEIRVADEFIRVIDDAGI